MSEVAPLEWRDKGFVGVGQCGEIFLLIELDEGKVLWQVSEINLFWLIHTCG